MLTGNPVAGLWEAAPWRGQAVQERQFQCLEAAGALFPRKAPAPSSTTCDFTVGWIYTWIPQRAAESSSRSQPASDPSTGTVSCSAATSALRFTAPLAQVWGHGDAMASQKPDRVPLGGQVGGNPPLSGQPGNPVDGVPPPSGLTPAAETERTGVDRTTSGPPLSVAPVPGLPVGGSSQPSDAPAPTSKTPGETAGEGRPTRGRLATDSLSMPPVPAPAAQTPPESTLLSLW